MLIFRSSRSQMFFKIGVLKNFATLTGKLCWSLQAFFYRTPTVAGSGFSRKIVFFSWIWYLLMIVAPAFAPTPLKTRVKNLKSSLRNSSVKKGVLRNFAHFTGKHLCWSIILIELQAFRPTALLKRDSNTDVFLWNLQNF